MPDFVDRVFVEPLQRLNEQFAQVLPALVTVLFILIIGGAFAYLLRQLTYWILRRAGFDRVTAPTTWGTLIRRSGVFRTPADFTARMVQGVVWLFIILIALAAMDTELTRNLLVQFVNYIPNIVVAVLVLLLGSLFSKFLARSALLAAVNAQWAGARLLAGIVRVLVMALAVVVALEQLRIGRTALLVAFAIFFAGIVLAVSLAFGLAARDTVHRWLESRTRAPAPEDEVVRHL